MLNTKKVLSGRRSCGDCEIDARLVTRQPPRVVLCANAGNLEPVPVPFIAGHVIDWRAGEIGLSRPVVIDDVGLEWLQVLRVSNLVFVLSNGCASGHTSFALLPTTNPTSSPATTTAVLVWGLGAEAPLPHLTSGELMS